MNAPIIVFAYNRDIHLDNMLGSLAKNDLASESDVYIFIDGPKNEEGLADNKKVLETAEKYKAGFFRDCTIKNHDKNSGLSKSIISGVTEIIEKYGRVIVCEDDIITSPSYLTYMNEALSYYENDPKVFSVGGYVVPLSLPEGYTNDYIVTQRVSSVAWGIWKDRWDKIDWSMKGYKAFRFDPLKRKRFNRWGNDRSAMLDDQMNGRVNSWAIRFDYAMFNLDMYNVVPFKSLVKIGGFDGTGTHGMTKGESARFESDLSLALNTFNFGPALPNEEIRSEFNRFYFSGFSSNCKRFFGNLLYGCIKK